jgi:hypothetical protein
MFKWLGGIAGTVISAVIIWMITKPHEPTVSRGSQNPHAPIRFHGPGPVPVASRTPPKRPFSP